MDGQVLDAAVAVEWIEATTGFTVTEVKKQARWRPLYFVRAMDDGGGVHELVLRASRDPERKAKFGIAGRFTIAHEALILEALQGSDVKVPEFYGFHEPTQSILMGRINGTANIQFLQDKQFQARLKLEYFENIARLHRLDIEKIGLTSKLAPLRTDEDIALDYLRTGEEELTAFGPLDYPEPLLAASRAWLRRNVPAPLRGVSLVQGDSGPAQFMFDETGITAIIDWETGHFGDPFHDLGVVRLRNLMYPMGHLTPGYRRYEEVSGFRLDPAIIKYYTVLVTTFNICAFVRQMQRPRETSGGETGRNDASLQMIASNIRNRRALSEALLEALDAPVPAVEVPVRAEDARFHDTLLDRLAFKHLPTAKDSLERADLFQSFALAESLRRQAWIGRECREGEMADMAEALGTRARDYMDGLRRLEELGSRGDDASVLRVARASAKMVTRQFMLLEPIIRVDRWDDESDAEPPPRPEPHWSEQKREFGPYLPRLDF